ncbi:hypothetical protein CPAR01_13590 [Colletotrichum paranaense]|uniref:Uncharacterized protein n=4 Tax=Colletotrichum acutatum species complex TaxID=2707335 RepID=A0AAI9Z7Y9_9PEZI|nr:uncharacterized protein CCOS01_01738 [Colletotrichum costaricense]XP_060343310.1 uncharacterized protein CPAR01_13590 [Colletotrichum paranaense]KAI3535523.1 hypothetical protein CSPX01_11339 [Colletotrichum filicis]KAK1467276.1 hypothetical protein CMEL01_11269 [Colletotrichum melonis]KAK1524642.1 hypothetical protein CPAR01_13590 [Colletotrichum paranaense]KAK1536418.1 hypothetical protein CCOS01_01738 [Colletotrichum costaricense]
MYASILLTSLLAAGGAHAAVAQGSWGVRADYSRCDAATPLEVVLDGAQSSSSPSANITDFSIASPFSGSLVIKVAGAVGYGSPYPPQQVGVEVFAAATAGDPGVWANATVTPGVGQPASVAQIAWNTRSDVTVAPKEGETVSLETIFDGGSLVVYYCGLPEAGGPVA